MNEYTLTNLKLLALPWEVIGVLIGILVSLTCPNIFFLELFVLLGFITIDRCKEISNINDKGNYDSIKAM